MIKLPGNVTQLNPGPRSGAPFVLTCGRSAHRHVYLAKLPVPAHWNLPTVLVSDANILSEPESEA